MASRMEILLENYLTMYSGEMHCAEFSYARDSWGHPASGSGVWVDAALQSPRFTLDAICPEKARARESISLPKNRRDRSRQKNA